MLFDLIDKKEKELYIIYANNWYNSIRNQVNILIDEVNCETQACKMHALRIRAFELLDDMKISFDCLREYLSAEQESYISNLLAELDEYGN